MRNAATAFLIAMLALAGCYASNKSTLSYRRSLNPGDGRPPTSETVEASFSGSATGLLPLVPGTPGGYYGYGANPAVVPGYGAGAGISPCAYHRDYCAQEVIILEPQGRPARTVQQDRRTAQSSDGHSAPTIDDRVNKLEKRTKRHAAAIESALETNCRLAVSHDAHKDKILEEAYPDKAEREAFVSECKDELAKHHPTVAPAKDVEAEKE